MYDQPSKTCKLNTNVTTSRTCDIVHGTPEPNLQTCIDDGKLDWASESEENGDSSQSAPAGILGHLNSIDPFAYLFKK